MDIHHLLLVVGVLVLLSTLTSKLSERVGVPALLMFLGVGMLAGSDGIGGIYLHNAALANAIGTIALAYILFSGGLDTHWPSVRLVLGRGLLLSTVGVVVTTVLLGLFIWSVSGIYLAGSLLLAAIVSSTDAAAVFSVLRSGGVGLKGRVRSLLELESGSNDPMAIFLTLGLISILLNPESSWLQLVPMFLLQMSIGVVVGLFVGRLAVHLLNVVRLDYDGLYPVLTISIVVIVFGLAATLGGNGFLAVYVAGIVMGNCTLLNRRPLLSFHDGLGWLMQIGMFLVLGLLVFPSRLPSVAGMGLLVSMVLIFVARPTAVYLCLWGSAYDWRERTLIAWSGLRGAVPIVLATFPLLNGYPNSERIFHIVFFVVLTSVLLQGRLLMPLARWLGVDEPHEPAPPYPIEFNRTHSLQCETREFTVRPGAPAADCHIRGLGLPSDLLILLIRRGREFIVPRGKTHIRPHDSLLVLAEPERLHDTRKMFEEKASPPSPHPDVLKPTRPKMNVDD